MIKKYNIPQDYDSIKYKCTLCEDTGHIEGKGRCNCFKQKVINILYEQSNMSELMKKQNFETFDFSYFSKKKIAGYKLSPYENISVIKSFCEDYALNFEKAEKSTVKVTIELDTAEWKEANEQAYQRTKGRYQMPGFRKGKAPRAIISQFLLFIISVRLSFYEYYKKYNLNFSKNEEIW